MGEQFAADVTDFLRINAQSISANQVPRAARVGCSI
jgi:hypothetical protein